MNGLRLTGGGKKKKGSENGRAGKQNKSNQKKKKKRDVVSQFASEIKHVRDHLVRCM